ncbi:MAG: 3'-5' exonuclease [Planctomycetota bacterium]
MPERRLSHDRPVVFLDLEGTGLKPDVDRIVQIGMVRLHPDGRKETYLTLVNPGVPIPPEAFAVHGISDKDVASAPPFKDVAMTVLEFLSGADLGGFGIAGYDVPMLRSELMRAGKPDLDPSGRRVIDALRIFHRREPRNLAAGVKFYCGREFKEGHDALADAQASLDVLQGEIERYPDLPADVSALAAYCGEGQDVFLDIGRKLAWRGGKAVFQFGKVKGVTLNRAAAEHKDYLQWILRSDFGDDLKGILRSALEGKFPVPPGGA